MGANHEQDATNSLIQGELSKEEDGLVPPDQSLEKITNKHSGELINLQNFLSKIKEYDLEEVSAKVKLKLVELARDVEKDLEQWIILSRALSLADAPLPKDIEKIKPEERKNFNTTYEDRTGDEHKAENKEKINRFEPDMQEAIKLVSGAMEDCELPNMIIGSNAFIIEAGNKTNKIPDDVDMVAIIQDLPKAYLNFQKLQEAGKITGLKMVEIADLKGNKNGCFEIKGKVKTKNKKLIDISVFFQSIDPSKRNGVLNIGIEETTGVQYDFDGTKCTFANAETNGQVYLRSMAREIRLYDHKTFKEHQLGFLGLSAKGIQRMSNERIISGENFDQILARQQKSVENEDEETRNGAKILLDLKSEYDSRKASGTGLSRYVCAANEVSPDKCTPEEAVNLITKEVKNAMNEADNLYQAAELIFSKQDLNNKEKIEHLELIYKDVNSIYRQYDNKLKLLNKDDEDEFMMYAAVRSLENSFLYPIAADIWAKMNSLEN